MSTIDAYILHILDWDVLHICMFQASIYTLDLVSFYLHLVWEQL